MIMPILWFLCGFLCVIGGEAWVRFKSARVDHPMLSSRGHRILGLMGAYIFFRQHPAETLFLSFFGPLYLILLSMAKGK